jgi:hypothetical protein
MPLNPSPQFKRVNIHIDARLHDAFKSATAAQGKSMTDVLLDFVRDYVEKYLSGKLCGVGRD